MANSKITPVILENFNLGGLADSDWSGLKNSMSELVGLDLHSTPGLVKVRQTLTKTTAGTPVDEFCLAAIETSDGDAYWFSSESGKIWRESSDTYTLAHTTTPETGEAKCLGAEEYNGYLYWFTENRVHRIKISDLADWGTNAVEDWAELNLEQAALGGTGQTYTLLTSINEGATHRQTFTSVISPIESIAVNITAVGTGDWTLYIHDASNNLLGSKTITNGNLTTGFNIFEFASDLIPTVGAIYHIHVVSTVADGTVDSGVTVDLEEGSIKIYTTSDTEYHPTRVLNGILFIGDRHFVHQIEGQIFTAQALDIVPPLRIKALGEVGNDLLIGTIVNSSISKTKIYRWDTYSVSFFSSDPIDEVGINSFLEADNHVFVNAGLQGNIYVYNGEQLELFYKVPGDYSPTKYGTIHPNSNANLAGQVLFGFSNGSGNPTEQGVYTLGRNSRNYPNVIDLSYPISERSAGAFVLSGIEIGAILVKGSDLYVAWKRGSTKGLDKLDYSTKLSGAYMTSRVMRWSRDIITSINEIIVAYQNMPASCDIDIFTSANYTAFSGTADITVPDTDRKLILKQERLELNTLQVKLLFTTNSNDAPTLESLLVNIDK